MDQPLPCHEDLQEDNVKLGGFIDIEYKNGFVYSESELLRKRLKAMCNQVRVGYELSTLARFPNISKP